MKTSERVLVAGACASMGTLFGWLAMTDGAVGAIAGAFYGLLLGLHPEFP